jgi:16S rRNA (uracil1498-N3)-methyltransferase
VTARRFFVEGHRDVGTTVEIVGGDAHKIARVLRLSAGDRIEVIDSGARTFSASIDSVGRVVRATLLENTGAARPEAAALSVDVAQAVPKGRRMDYVVEKCTELGANAFYPFYCERSVGRDVGTEKLARWRRLARSAAQQCGRDDVPAIAAPVQLDALVARFAHYAVVLFAWESAQPAPLYDRLRSIVPPAGKLLVVVGPEGGFTHDEAELAERHGAALLWLGARILRTDTAAVALMAVIGAFAS